MYILISQLNEAYLGHGTKSPVSSTSQIISWLILPLSERHWSYFETAVALPWYIYATSKPPSRTPFGATAATRACSCSGVCTCSSNTCGGVEFFWRNALFAKKNMFLKAVRTGPRDFRCGRAVCRECIWPCARTTLGASASQLSGAPKRVWLSWEWPRRAPTSKFIVYIWRCPA